MRSATWRTRAFLGLLCTATMLATSSCSLQGDSPQRNQNAITYLDQAPFTGLYPPAAGFYPNGGVVNNITDRLLYQDPATGKLEPWIATALPEINEDATQFTFRIRKGVTYSDGSALDAENVARNFDLFGKGDKGRKLTPSEQISNYGHAEVLDSHTVRFHFTKPSPGFPQATSSMNAGLLANQSLALDNAGFGPGSATKVIGSGPFVIADEKIGTELTLKAREDYNWAPPSSPHQGKAHLDQVTVAVAAEDSVRVGALIADQAQIARQIEAPVEKLVEKRGLSIVAAPTSGVNNSWDLRFQHPYLQDLRVRQAIMHGIDRETLLRTLFSERYKLATSPLASTALGYQDFSNTYSFDPEKSKQLLDAAGWRPGKDGIREKDGQRLSLTVSVGTSQPRNREANTVLQAQMKQIGIEINIYPGDKSAQTAALPKLDTIQINSGMVGRADYDVIKSEFYSKNRNVLLNLNPATGQIGDPELEKLLEKVASSPAEADRARYSAEAQKLIVDKVYSIPLFEEPQVFGVQRGVTGFKTEAVGRPSFYDVRLEGH
ncbi:TIGR04028 family ABC transporter substrate-binding protein [Staphylococcus chromogenes]|nr:TIGR04028 family ABC transporter substrate-binding protein [Staphylococcus chromogenes]